MKTLADVYDTAKALGLIVGDFELDGAWHTVKATNGKKIKKSGTYCLSELNLKNGKVAIVGLLTNFLTNEEEKLTLDGVNDVSPEELAEARRLARKAAEEGKKAREQLQIETAQRALKTWDNLPSGGKSDYLFRKKVRPHGIRFARGSVVVPARDINGKLWTLQWIDSDGNKRFMTGGAMRGKFHLIGLPQGEQPPLIAVAEGYATGASIHEAKSWPVAVAFNAGNLMPVVLVLREQYPSALIVVCSDHDIYNGYPHAFIKQKDITSEVRALVARLNKVRPDVLLEFVADDDPRTKDREKSHNVGLAASVLAAAKVGGLVLVPKL